MVLPVDFALYQFFYFVVCCHVNVVLRYGGAAFDLTKCGGICSSGSVAIVWVLDTICYC